MADPGIQALRAGPEMLSGTAIPFRFDVTCRSLTRPLAPTPTNAAALTRPASLPKLSSPSRGPGPEAKEWEMVLPRMRRPAALASPASQGRFSPEDTQGAAVSAPSFGVTPNFGASNRWMLFAGAPLLILVAAFILGGKGSAPAGRTDSGAMEMGSAGWITEWASDAAGSARARQISLYRPSLAMSDYSVEFLGEIERRSLGWVFRAADTRNYYVGKIEAANPSAPLTITHFAVVHGVEGTHVQRVLASATDSILKVRLEAHGPRFTVYLQNQVVEDWQDDRLKSGGVGFLNEREEQGKVWSIRISFPKGGIR